MLYCTRRTQLKFKLLMSQLVQCQTGVDQEWGICHEFPRNDFHRR